MSPTRQLTKVFKADKERVQHPRPPARPGTRAGSGGQGHPAPCVRHRRPPATRHRGEAEAGEVVAAVVVIIITNKKKKAPRRRREGRSRFPRSPVASPGWATQRTPAQLTRAGPGWPDRDGQAGEAAAAPGHAAPPASSPPRRSSPTIRQLHGAGAAQRPRQPVELLHGSLHPRRAQPGAAAAATAAASPLSPSRRRRRGASPGPRRPLPLCTCAEGGRPRAGAAGGAGVAGAARLGVGPPRVTGQGGRGERGFQTCAV